MKRRLKRLAIFLGIIAALMVAFYAEENWRGAREWARVSAELKAKGYPLTVSDITPPPVPDADNVFAAPIFAELFTADGRENKEARLVKAGALGPREGLLPSLKTCKPGDLRRYFDGRDTLTEQEAARKILAELEPDWSPLLAEAAAALQRPKSRWPLAYEQGWSANLLQFVPVLKIARAWQLRALAHLELGEREQARQDLECLLRLAHIMKSQPLVASWLMGNICENNALGVCWDGMMKRQWDAADLARLQHAARSAQEQRAAQLKQALAADQVYFLNLTGNMGKLLTAVGIHKWSDRLLCAAGIEWSGRLNFNRCRYVEFNVPMLETLDEENNRVEVERFKASQRQLWMYYGSLVRVILCPLPKLALVEHGLSFEKAARAQTEWRMTDIACALERYRLANGAVPDDLASLAPEYIDKLPAQVVNGEPFIYRKVSVSDYILYSVGWNLNDDGGKWSKQSDKGDWVWASKPELCQELK